MRIARTGRQVYDFLGVVTGRPGEHRYKVDFNQDDEVRSHPQPMTVYFYQGKDWLNPRNGAEACIRACEDLYRSMMVKDGGPSDLNGKTENVTLKGDKTALPICLSDKFVSTASADREERDMCAIESPVTGYLPRMHTLKETPTSCVWRNDHLGAVVFDKRAAGVAGQAFDLSTLHDYPAGSFIIRADTYQLGNTPRQAVAPAGTI